MNRNASNTGAQLASGISKTAIWVAAARAIGAREPDESVRNPDSLAEALLGDPAQLEFDHPVVDALRASYEEAMREMEIADLVRAMAERTRFIDEALERAIRAGASQVLIPGAGFDSHAYRYRDLLERARVFEVDRPATLAFKQRRVADVLGAPPANITYVPLDLQHDKLPTALVRHGYDASQRTFVIMEGLTMYLPEDDLRALFRFVAAHAPGTSVVFDFATRTMVEGLKHIDLDLVPPMARPSMKRFLDMTKDEPWLFGFPVGEEDGFLADVGLRLREALTIGSDEAARRYLTRADGTTLGAEGHAKAEALRKAAQDAATAHLAPEQREAMAQRMREQARHMAYRIAEAAVPPR